MTRMRILAAEGRGMLGWILRNSIREEGGAEALLEVGDAMGLYTFSFLGNCFRSGCGCFAGNDRAAIFSAICFLFE